jgi:methionyl-tRNA synthetase
MTYWRRCKHVRNARGDACSKCGAQWTVDALTARYTAPAPAKGEAA